MHVHFFSQSLIRSVPLTVIVPADGALGAPSTQRQTYKTLYLLHGYCGDETDWLHNTNLVEIAQLHNIAVVCPSGENWFYLNGAAPTVRYFDLLVEIVEFTRRVFPLSEKREDTIIGGLSMGGYGAVTNGLKRHDIFGHVIGLSSAFIMDEANTIADEPNPMGTNRDYFQMIYGDLSKLPSHAFNPKHVAETVKDELEPDFDLFFCCGINDFLVYPNRDFHFHLKKLGIPHTYKEGPGTHDFKFWDEWLRVALERVAPKAEQLLMPFYIPDAPPLEE
jgi:S-formylglutathione hydrolase FrmB